MQNTEFHIICQRFSDLNFNLNTWSRNPDLKILVDKLSKIFEKSLTAAEAKWCMVNKIQPQICTVCENEHTPFRGATLGYQRTCSIKCSRKLDSFLSKITTPDIITKRKETLKKTLSKLGVANVGQLQSTKEKIKKTNLERYGVNTPFQNNDVKEKIRNTNTVRYGSENVLSTNSSIREELNILKASAKEERRKQKEIEKQQKKKEIISKYGKEMSNYQITNLEKYGVTCSWQREDVKEKIRNTNKIRYGTVVASKNKTISSKISKSKVANYITSSLESRLRDLKMLGTVPDGWDKDSYTGGMMPFIHSCGEKFVKKFYSGDLPKCPKCQTNRSSLEHLVSSWLDEVGIEHKLNDRTQIKPYELDFVTDRLAIEINGIYWHHDDSGKQPLLNKSKMYAGDLLHFWDFEIENKPSIVKSLILAKHGKFQNRIFARKCKIVKLQSSDARLFFDANHLQGYANAHVNYGLVFNNDVVMAMSFGKPRFSKDSDFELIRLASLTNTLVIGGASKILKTFIEEFKPKCLLSYSDKRISKGSIYKSLGFQFSSTSKPNYFWVKGSKRKSRYETQKHLLPNFLDNFDKNISESANMIKNGWNKCSDCGNDKWILRSIPSNS